MNVYLIRHGETIHNQQKVHQYSTSPLSEKGVAQALQLAERLRAAKIDKIFASPMIRAQQTAQSIATASGLTFETHNDLREVARPTIFVGKQHNDPDLVDIKKEIKEHFHEEKWRYSDEENFQDMLARAQSIVKMLESETEEDILLVSHGNFIAALVSLVLFHDQLTSDIFLAVKKRSLLSNTGITHCSYSPTSGWKLVSLNDTTHLN